MRRGVSPGVPEAKELLHVAVLETSGFTQFTPGSFTKQLAFLHQSARKGPFTHRRSPSQAHQVALYYRAIDREEDSVDGHLGPGVTGDRRGIEVRRRIRS